MPNIKGTKLYVTNIEPLKENDVFERFYHTASVDRRRKVDELRHEKDKRLSLASDLLLRKALLREGIDRFEVRYGQFGKPYIEMENVFFNLSHSEDVVVCAISPKDIGCDVQKVKDVDIEIAKRFFSITEYEMIESARSDNDKYNLFFRLWTLKESFLKVTGRGFNLPLNRFCIDFSQNDIVVHQSVNEEKYYFKEYDFLDGYKCAVCSLINYFVDEEFVSIV